MSTSAVVVSGAFEVNGDLYLPDADGNLARLIPVVDRGTATINLVRNPFHPVWEFQRVEYSFERAAPIPEPATIWLVGSA